MSTMPESPDGRFTLEYHGPALAEGRMDARDAGDAIVAMSRLVERISDITIPGNKQISLQVDAHFRSGSFDIDFSIVSYVHGVISHLTPDQIKLLIAALIGEAGIIGVFLKLRGIKPEKVVKKGNVVEIHTKGEYNTVNATVYNMLMDGETVAALGDVAKPLKRPGYEKMKLKSPQLDAEQEVKRGEERFLKEPLQRVEERIVSTSDVVLELTEVDFKEGHKWEFRQGETEFYASIDHPAFLDRVRGGLEKFAAGDTIWGRMETETVMHDGRIVGVERRLVHVEEHRSPGVEQTMLELPEPPRLLEAGADHAGASLNDPLFLSLVHESGFAADEGFIHFDFASELVERAILHGEPNAVQHEPSGLLGHTNGARQLVRRNPVLAISEHPNGREPLGQAERGVLEDSPDFDRELMPTVAAFPATTGLHEVMLSDRPAFVANLLTFGPAKIGDEYGAGILIREVANRFEESGREVCFAGHRSVPADCVFSFNTRNLQ